MIQGRLLQKKGKKKKLREIKVILWAICENWALFFISLCEGLSNFCLERQVRKSESNFLT